MKIIDRNQSYTFSKYFEIGILAEDLVKEFNYTFARLSELITLDYWQENQDQTELIGAVTTGKIWEFTKLNRENKHIEQGLESYRVPEDLELLMRILIQALS